MYFRTWARAILVIRFSLKRMAADVIVETESGVAPPAELANHRLVNPPFPQEHLEHPVAEEVEHCEFSPASSCWCSQTVTVLGPDDILCAPEMCQSGRARFEAR